MLKLGLCTLRCGPWSHLSANFTLHWRCYGRRCKNPANSNHVLGGYPLQTVDKVITDSLTLLESGKIIIVPCGGICSGRPHHLLVIKIMMNLKDLTKKVTTFATGQTNWLSTQLSRWVVEKHAEVIPPLNILNMKLLILPIVHLQNEIPVGACQAVWNTELEDLQVFVPIPTRKEDTSRSVPLHSQDLMASSWCSPKRLTSAWHFWWTKLSQKHLMSMRVQTNLTIDSSPIQLTARDIETLVNS